jgi:S-formylglutathione hydrolase FrmB
MASRVRAFLLLLLICWIGPVQAGEVSRDRTFLSEALAGPMRYSLYLPDAYREQTDARFPVVYLLHGYGADNNEWLDFGHADETLDRLIASGQIPPIIAVMPYAEKSWYVDSASLGGPGDYETAIVRDLAAHVEAEYRAIPERRARYIAGLSMGGYGAMRFAFFHPGRYQAAASLSGALFEDVGIPSFAGPVETGDADMQEQADFWFLGAYGRPFDAGIFRERNPFSRIGELGGGGGAPEILIMSGSDDFFGFHKGSAALHTALKRAGIEAELLIEEGGHEWELWRAQFPRVMQFLAGVMKNADGSSGR